MSLPFKMIGNGSAHLEVGSENFSLDLLFFQLEKEDFPDLLIDDPHNRLQIKEIAAIIAFQESHHRCTVLVKAIATEHNFPSEVVVVPTVVEAVDYLSFEQMQRDLGL
jgi:SHS2 domain-containing protein